jgi:hypothetical protein
MVFEIQGDFESAIADLDTAVRRFHLFAPKLSWSPKALAFARRADFFKRRGDNTKAVLNKVLSLCTSLLSGRVNLKPLSREAKKHMSILD